MFFVEENNSVFLANEVFSDIDSLYDSCGHDNVESCYCDDDSKW